MPFILSSGAIFGETGVTTNAIPLNLKIAFLVGGIIFLGCIIYTVVTTPESPPQNWEEFKKLKASSSFFNMLKEIVTCIRQAPKSMRKVALVQFFTWPGLFLMWIYFVPAVAVDIFGATSTEDPIYAKGSDWGKLCFAVYSAVTFIFSFALPSITNRIGCKWTHFYCLLIAALSLFLVGYIAEIETSIYIKKYLLFIPMIGIGIAWASILSMPYTLIAFDLPKSKIGIYMGIFNFCIVIPEIIAALGFKWVMKYLLNNQRISALLVAAVIMIIAAFFLLRIKNDTHKSTVVHSKV